MTDNERIMLQAIVDSEYQDAAEPVHYVNHQVWDFSVYDRCEQNGIARASMGGVMSSLAKKGWADTQEYDEDDIVWITAEGVKALFGLDELPA